MPLRRFAPPPHTWGGPTPSGMGRTSCRCPSGASRHLPTRGEDQLLVEWGRQVGEAPPALRATFPTRGEDQLLVEWGGQVGEAPPALRATSPHVGRTNS